MNFYCENCNQEVDTKFVKRNECLPVKGDNITVDTCVRICTSCNQDIYDRELDKETIHNAYQVYRKKHNILSPTEIKDIREQYGLSQKNLALLLGWGEVTLHRYEKGNIPDASHNQQLILIKEPKNLYDILSNKGYLLSETVRKKLEDRVLNLLSDEKPFKVLDILLHSTFRKPSLNTGNKSFNFELLREMIYFFASKNGGVLKTKLNKLLWYADFTHFRFYTTSISGSTYIHLQYGPVVKDLEYYLPVLMDEDEIDKEEIQFSEDMIGENIRFNDCFEPKYLSDTHLKVLEAVYNRFKSSTSTEISKISHEEDGYKETNDKELISYEYAERLKENFGLELL